MIDPHAVHQVAVDCEELLVQLAAAVVVEPVPVAKCGLALALPAMAAATAAARRANVKCANRPARAVHIDPVRNPDAVWPVDGLVERLGEVRGRVRRCLGEAGAVDEGVASHLRRMPLATVTSGIDTLPCSPDDRRAGRRHGLRTFAGSTDYRTVRHEYVTACLPGHEPPGTEVRLAVADQARIQRDELDAVETFARVLSAVALPAHEVLTLADLASDEARHADLGRTMLVGLGLDPARLSVSTGGVVRRAELGPLGSMAQNVAVGEVTNLAEMRRVLGWAGELGLDDYAQALAAIIRDEQSHIRSGYEILRRQLRESDDTTARREIGAHLLEGAGPAAAHAGRTDKEPAWT